MGIIVNTIVHWIKQRTIIMEAQSERNEQSKADMSHYFGFGNIAVDKLSMNSTKCTGLEPSGKFKEKLLLKQRQVEEMMIENRIKKLAAEEAKLMKQIDTATKHTNFAKEVQQRRNSDYQAKLAHK